MNGEQREQVRKRRPRAEIKKLVAEFVKQRHEASSAGTEVCRCAPACLNSSKRFQEIVESI